MSDPGAVVRIEALGTDTQQNVRPVGLAWAGDMAAANDDGAVDAARSGALAVSHFTTAAAALAWRAAVGPLATAAVLRSAAAGVTSGEVLSLGTLIHLVADEGLALPDGVADTLALAQDATASTALLAAQRAGSSAAEALRQAQSRAVAAAPADGDLPTDGVLVACSGLPGTGGGVMLTFANDDKAMGGDSRGTRSGGWARQGDAVIVTLDTPFSTTTFSADFDPVTGRQTEIRHDGSRRKHLRLGNGPAGAAFLVIDRSGSALRTRWIHLRPPGDGFVFDATTGARIWRRDAPGVTVPDIVTLRPDGTGTCFGLSATWEVESEGRRRIVRALSSSLQTRYSWLPLRRAADGSVWVL